MYEFWYVRVLNYQVIQHVNMGKSCNHTRQYLRRCRRWNWYWNYSEWGFTPVQTGWKLSLSSFED